MKKNAILCVLIAATLLVTVLVASAEAATINQTAASTTTNVNMTATAPGWYGGWNIQDVTITNFQAQGAVAVETGDINIVGGDVTDSSYEKAGSCEKNPSPATINQVAAPTTTNVNMTAPESRWDNRQTVIIRNVQVQAAGIVQTEDINVVVGDIDDSSYSKVCPAPRAAPGPAPAPRPAPAPNGSPAPRP